MKLKKEYLLPVVVILIICFVSFTLLPKSIMGIFELREEKEEMEAELNILKTKYQALLSLNEQDLTSKVEQVEKVFPSKQPVMALIGSVAALAEEEGLRFAGAEIDEKSEAASGSLEGEKNKAESFPITFGVTGDLDKALSFARKLDKIPPVMKLESLSITFTIKEGEEAPKAGEKKAVELVATVYYQEPPATIDKVSDPLPTISVQEENLLTQLKEFKFFPGIPATAQTGKEDDLFR